MRILRKVGRIVTGTPTNRQQHAFQEYVRGIQSGQIPAGDDVKMEGGKDGVSFPIFHHPIQYSILHLFCGSHWLRKRRIVGINHSVAAIRMVITIIPVSSTS